MSGAGAFLQDDLPNVLSFADRERLATTLWRLTQIATGPLLVVGSIALRIHLHRRDYPALDRSLNDLDLAVSDLDSLPVVEGKVFLVSHYHPKSALSSSGRMLLQLVDEETRLRIDIFQTLAGAIDRASSLGDSSSLCVVSVEDILVRTLLVLQAQAASGMATTKYVETIQRLSDIVNMERANQLWATARNADQPASIHAAIAYADGLLRARPSSDRVVEYGRLDDPPCDLCERTDRYPLADKQRIFDTLGYI